jgi:membrane protein DedA with SNARE-associated domain
VLHWLHELLPQLPRYGFLLVFIVVFLNNIGFPLPGETILLGAGFMLGRSAESLWPPIAAGTLACFLGGACAFWAGRKVGRSGLERFRWLHLTPRRMKWPDRFFERHGARTVFIARFIALFPPVVANLLAGMSKISWPEYLAYDLAGSAAYSATYILVGHFFGRRWKAFEAWLGPLSLTLILAAVVLVALGVAFRHPLSRLLARRHALRGR